LNMSLQKGNMGKTGSQKHQNKVGWAHNKKSKETERMNKIPADLGCCRRCTDKINWKKQYRKYKVRAVPGRCGWCKQKNVILAYHALCRACAKPKRACAKCTKPLEDNQVEPEREPLDDASLRTLIGRAVGMKERDRRVVIRKWTAGEMTDDDVWALFEEEEDEDDNKKDGDGDDAAAVPAKDHGKGSIDPVAAAPAAPAAAAVKAAVKVPDRGYKIRDR